MSTTSNDLAPRPSPLSGIRARLKHLRTRGPRALASRCLALVAPPRRDGHVLIIHNGRSGSTLLGDMLDQHPKIFWDGETFEKLAHRTAEAEGIGVDHLYGRFTLEDGVAEVARRMRTRSGPRIFGSEIQDYHIEMMGTTIGEYIDAMKQLGFTNFVFLDRNYLRKIISGLVAVDRDQFHVAAGKDARARRITVDFENSYIGHRFTSVLGTLRQYTRFRQEAMTSLADEDVLELTYEQDLRRDPRVAADKVCRHLGLKPFTPAVRYGKTTAFSLKDIVDNYDQLESYLSGTPYAQALREAA